MKKSKDYREGWRDALRTLATAMHKVLTPEQLEDLKWSCDPFGQFMEVLQVSPPKKGTNEETTR